MTETRLDPNDLPRQDWHPDKVSEQEWADNGPYHNKQLALFVAAGVHKAELGHARMAIDFDVEPVFQEWNQRDIDPKIISDLTDLIDRYGVLDDVYPIYLIVDNLDDLDPATYIKDSHAGNFPTLKPSGNADVDFAGGEKLKILATGGQHRWVILKTKYGPLKAALQDACAKEAAAQAAYDRAVADRAKEKVLEKLKAELDAAIADTKVKRRAAAEFASWRVVLLSRGECSCMSARDGD